MASVCCLLCGYYTLGVKHTSPKTTQHAQKITGINTTNGTRTMNKIIKHFTSHFEEAAKFSLCLWLNSSFIGMFSETVFSLYNFLRTFLYTKMLLKNFIFIFESLQGLTIGFALKIHVIKNQISFCGICKLWLRLKWHNSQMA